MPHKQLFFRSEARENILRGATALADAVRVNARPQVEVCDDRAEVGSPIASAAGVLLLSEATLTEAPGAEEGTGRRAAGLVTRSLHLADRRAVSNPTIEESLAELGQ